MNSEKKKKMARLVERISKKMESIQTMPSALADRILKFGILSFCILFFGCYMGIRMDSLNFVFWSIAISVFGFFRAGRLLWLAERQEYDTVEGTVYEIKGKHSLGRMYRIGLQLENGQTTQLLMDKRQRFQIGKRYRFYFNKKQEVLSGIKKLDVMLNVNSFYGFEEVE
ncbi:MAG: hypothetical protein SPF19_11290 [Oliverpabstia sp.]|nr:hypothetical protein [bacterium]MDY5027081.1 hypothetical protein [Oliverpabstia sp.]